MKNCLLLVLAAALVASAFGAPAPSPAPTDPLGRLTPRDTVTHFLEACQKKDYAKAAQYLDLSKLPERLRATEGPQLARDLESVLNSDSKFNASTLPQQPPGDVEHAATVTLNGRTTSLDLHRVTPANGPAIWLFTPQTVSELPKLVPVPSTESVIEARLPRFLVTAHIEGTPVWKWLALLIMAAILFAIVRLVVRIIQATLNRSLKSFAWVYAIIEPLLVICAVAIFKGFVEFINPTALSREFVGDFLLMVVVWSIAWGLSNVFDVFLRRVDTFLDPRQRVVAHSLIYLSRRIGKVLIFGFAIIIILDNWGFRMTTVIAGLGVGGIAVALAAQQTIANVFGGVSVIGDNPVMIGDFGSFGGVVGTVEEIGLRSARIRTLNRTIVSIPNSSFSTINLENYAERDKILFNPTIQIKRATPKDNVRHLMRALHDTLAANKHVEIGPTPVRISAYSAASFSIEIFAYVKTPDINEFYKHEADLFLAIDDAVLAANVELV